MVRAQYLFSIIMSKLVAFELCYNPNTSKDNLNSSLSCVRRGFRSFVANPARERGVHHPREAQRSLSPKLPGTRCSFGGRGPRRRTVALLPWQPDRHGRKLTTQLETVLSQKWYSPNEDKSARKKGTPKPHPRGKPARVPIPAHGCSS